MRVICGIWIVTQQKPSVYNLYNFNFDFLCFIKQYRPASAEREPRGNKGVGLFVGRPIVEVDVLKWNVVGPQIDIFFAKAAFESFDCWRECIASVQPQ
jgi:hypothetical protein